MININYNHYPLKYNRLNKEKVEKESNLDEKSSIKELSFSSKKKCVRIAPLALALMLGVSGVSAGCTKKQEIDISTLPTMTIIENKPVLDYKVPEKSEFDFKSLNITKTNDSLEEYFQNPENIDKKALINAYIDIARDNINPDYLSSINFVEDFDFENLDEDTLGNFICSNKEINLNSDLFNEQKYKDKNALNSKFHITNILTTIHELTHANQCETSRLYKDSPKVNEVNIYKEVEANVAELNAYKSLKEKYSNFFSIKHEILLNIYQRQGVEGLEDYVKILYSKDENEISVETYLKDQSKYLFLPYAYPLIQYLPMEYVPAAENAMFTINDHSQNIRDNSIPIVMGSHDKESGRYSLSIHFDRENFSDIYISFMMAKEIVYQQIMEKNPLSEKEAKTEAEKAALEFYENYKELSGKTDPALEEMLNKQNSF